MERTMTAQTLDSGNIIERIRQRMHKHFLTRRQVIALLYERSTTTSLSNLLLFVVCVLLTRFTYGWTYVKDDLFWSSLSLFIAVVIVGYLAGTPDLMARPLDTVHLDSLAKWVRARSSREPTRWDLFRKFDVLMLLVLLDFFAAARLINLTGGWYSSPFSQLPAIMLILGGVMAYQWVTRVFIFGGGLVYFVLLSYAGIGSVQHPEATGPLPLSVDFLLVTVLSLGVSLIVISRKDEATPPTSTLKEGSE